jgi:glycine/D-amino acid oxidase-like deaminating enzyme
MDLESGRPFWPIQNGLIRSYPRLRGSIQCDVVVVGAGITGAIIADELVRAGFDVIILDRRDVATGSTAASTALLQYEMDTSLRELQQWYGPSVARELYRSGLESIRTVKALCQQLPESGGFQDRASLYLASTENDAHDLRHEYTARKAENLPVEFLDRTAIHARYDFAAPAAIYSLTAGEIDPYQLTHALLHRVTDTGGRVFDRTEIRSWTSSADGVHFETEWGDVRADWGVIAAGYESTAFLPNRVASMHSTFAFVSEPLAAFPGWPDRCLIWETARPYLYLRTTSDNRILAGGGDSPFSDAAARDQALPSKINEIVHRVHAMFPRIEFEIDYAWAGTFAETEDGLPFIGEHPDRPGLLFALSYGGNGITYSVLAASILRAHLQGQRHPLANAVRFGRRPQANE